jgi:GNAT superfamily N-acetyltransferase
MIPQNQDFNQWLKSGISERKLASEYTFGLLFNAHPNYWGEQLDRLLAPQGTIHSTRRHYRLQSIDYDWRPQVPEGFTIQLIDESLLEHDEIDDDVRNLIQSNMEACTPAGPLGVGFGFVALHDSILVAQAIIDVIVGEKGEIGLVTDPGYRRRGLATITSGAAIEFGLANGLSTVYWDCNAGNTTSLRTAQVLGFQFECEHEQYVYIYDQVRAMVNRAWRDMESGDYTQTIEDCDWLIDQGEGGLSHAHYLSAVAHAGLGEVEKALEHLNTAWKIDWDDQAN